MSTEVTSSAAGAPRLTRIVTCYRQWPCVAHWSRWEACFSADVEWIIVNDCPADPCPAALAATLLARGVQIVTPPENLGRSGARNFGAALARGEWLENLDGDDLPLPVEVTSWPAVAEYDGLQFPAPEVRRDARSIDAPAMYQTLEVAPADTWAPLLPQLRPFDVRLTATMWRRDFYVRMGGYDGRFEGIEDVHLAFKAARMQARIGRMTRPKQIYCRRGERETFSRVRVEGAARFFRWLRVNHPDVAPQIVTGWLAKEEAYLALLTAGEVVRHPLRWFNYGKWRLFS